MRNRLLQLLPCVMLVSCSAASAANVGQNADHNRPSAADDAGGAPDGGEGSCDGTCVSSLPRLALGEEHACVLVADGSVKCWGSNQLGQLGRLPTTSRDDPQPPSKVEGLESVTSLSAGEFHTCAVVSDHVRCWGSSNGGAIGNGTGGQGAVATPVEATNLSNVTAVSAGSLNTCAVRADGKVFCWGLNWAGSAATTPAEVDGLSHVTQVGITLAHACALLDDATVACWGESGTVGSSAPNGSPTPVTIDALSDVTSIALGNTHTCALRRNGHVSCWGSLGTSGYKGQLGDSATRTEGSLSPVEVAGIADAIAIAAGSDHTCALLSTKRVKCWGENVSGQSGAAGHDPVRLPHEVDGVDEVAALAAGFGRSCAVKADGSILCWGDGNPKPTRLAGVP